MIRDNVWILVFTFNSFFYYAGNIGQVERITKLEQ